jgi:hypothetical protein
MEGIRWPSPRGAGPAKRSCFNLGLVNITVLIYVCIYLFIIVRGMDFFNLKVIASRQRRTSVIILQKNSLGLSTAKMSTRHQAC